MVASCGDRGELGSWAFILEESGRVSGAYKECVVSALEDLCVFSNG